MPRSRPFAALIALSSPVVVTFDTPGATPRPYRETVVAIAPGSTRLAMRVTKITYRGLACGVTFRGTRPPSPVTIRMQGTVRRRTLDSGPLRVAWSATSTRDTDAGLSSDKNAGWSFVAAANVNRNGTGWVVSLTGLANDRTARPSALSCTIDAPAGAAFAPANGPAGYWSGFATV